MKTLLAMTLMFAVVLGLAAWLDDPDSPAPQAGNLQRLLERSNTVTNRQRSMHIDVSIVAKQGGLSVPIAYEAEAASIDRMYFKFTRGLQTEFFTDRAKICIRQGQSESWVERPDVNPLGRPINSSGFVSVFPLDTAELLEDDEIDGMPVFHIRSVPSAAERQMIFDESGNEVPEGLSGVKLEYYIGKKDSILRRLVLSYDYDAPGNARNVNATLTMDLSRFNEPAQIPSHVPQTCTTAAPRA